MSIRWDRCEDGCRTLILGDMPLAAATVFDVRGEAGNHTVTMRHVTDEWDVDGVHIIANRYELESVK